MAAESSSAPLDPAHLLRLSPDTLIFNDVRPNVQYGRRLEVTNPLATPLEIAIKPGNPERYTISRRLSPSVLARRRWSMCASR